MLIAIVDISVPPADRARFLDEVTKLTPTIRTQTGCQSWCILPDPENAEKAIIQQIWQDQNAFDAYKATPDFAALGALLMPNLTAPPISRQYDAALVGEPA